MEKQETFLISIPKDQVCTVISEYYKNKGFKGEAAFEFTGYCIGSDWGGYDDYRGRIDLIFTEKITILNQETEKKTKISTGKIYSELKDIFNPLLEDENFMITNADFDIYAYDRNNVDFKGVFLRLKSKEKEKQLQK